jgi:hypothetical protein
VASPDQPVPVVPSQVPILGELFDVVRTGQAPPLIPGHPPSKSQANPKGLLGRYFRRLLGSLGQLHPSDEAPKSPQTKPLPSPFTVIDCKLQKLPVGTVSAFCFCVLRAAGCGRTLCFLLALSLFWFLFLFLGYTGAPLRAMRCVACDVWVLVTRVMFVVPCSLCSVFLFAVRVTCSCIMHQSPLNISVSSP